MASLPKFDLADIKRRMQGAHATLKQELGGLRTGRASVGLLEPVQIEAYGQRMPINQTLRIRIPELNEQRRKEMVKVAHKYSEDARVAVRHVRRDGLDVLKKLLKDHAISEDDEKRHEAEVQKATDEAIREIDALLAGKEKEIMQV
jgi:ribosome recycling factor